MRDPSIKTWRQIDLANGSFGQGVAVTPLQLATAYARDDQRRPADPAARGPGRRDPATRQVAGKGQVISADALEDAHRDDEPRRRRRCRSTATGPSSRATRSAARPARRRSGTPRRTAAEAAGSTTSSTTRSSGTSRAQAGHPDLVVAIRIEEGTPTVAKLGQLEMPVMSFELFRRIAHDAITTPDLLPERHDVPPPTTATR